MYKGYVVKVFNLSASTKEPMELLSTNKPEVEKKPEVKIEYNDRSYQSYIKNGFADNIPHSISAPHDRIQKFLSQVDIRKGPIERTVRMMVRLRAPDWNTQKNERKEWIYYEEDWSANNWLGIPITKGAISGHIEGKYTEVLMRPKLDERTGEHIDNVFAGTRESYYIPFSKKNVDEIIANSAHTDKSGIRFIVKFAAEDSTSGDNMVMTMSMRNQFNYEMFANWSWDKLFQYQTWPVDEIATRPSTSKTATKLEFKPQ
jgi:hypothetical protein